jgi:hypothetical protein
VWEIVLLILGSPIWLSLLAAAVVVALSVYAVLWSVITVFWASFATLAACAPVGLLIGIFFAFSGNVIPGIAMIGAGIFLGGAAIFAFFGCLAATKGLAWLTKAVILSIKKRIVKKNEEEAL